MNPPKKPDHGRDWTRLFSNVSAYFELPDRAGLQPQVKRAPNPFSLTRSFLKTKIRRDHAQHMRKIFFNQRGLRAGWRLLIFVGIFVALGFLAKWTIQKIPGVSNLRKLPFLDPWGIIESELEALVQVGIATWIMARIERRPFSDYGIPLGNAFGRDFWVGLGWGLASTSLLIGLIASFGGYRVLGLAIHGRALWYFLAVWILANLLIGFSEEIQFRAYLLATLADGVGFWSAAILLSTGFGALHYFLKPYEHWEDFASTGLLGLFMCLTLRRTGSLALAIGFHAAFDWANLFLWSGQNAGEYAVGHLLETRWQGPQWLIGGRLGPEASWMVFVVIALMFLIFPRLYPDKRFPLGVRHPTDPRVDRRRTDGALCV